MSYIQRFVGFLLCMCVSVCFVTAACWRPPAHIFGQSGVGGRPPGPPMPGSASGLGVVLRGHIVIIIITIFYFLEHSYNVNTIHEVPNNFFSHVATGPTYLRFVLSTALTSSCATCTCTTIIRPVARLFKGDKGSTPRSGREKAVH